MYELQKINKVEKNPFEVKSELDKPLAVIKEIVKKNKFTEEISAKINEQSEKVQVVIPEKLKSTNIKRISKPVKKLDLQNFNQHIILSKILIDFKLI